MNDSQSQSVLQSSFTPDAVDLVVTDNANIVKNS